MTFQARYAEDSGDYSAAAALLGQAVQSDPQNCETRLELSELLLEGGSSHVAMEHLRAVVVQSPDDARGYVRLAQALCMQQRQAEAEPLLRTALELDPSHPTGLYLLGQLLEEQGLERDALDLYYRAIPLLPNPVEAEYHVARIKLKSGQREQAILLLREVVDHSQACASLKAEAYWLLGQAYRGDERWLEAAVAMQSSLQLQPRTVESWQQVAAAFEIAGDQKNSEHCQMLAQTQTSPETSIPPPENARGEHHNAAGWVMHGNRFPTAPPFPADRALGAR